MKRKVLFLVALLLLQTTLGSACSSSTNTPTPTLVPTAAKPTAAPIKPTSTVQPSSTPATKPTPASLKVANTDGEGVFIRRTPSTADKIKAWPDGTIMVTVGEDREAEARKWHNVKDPDGNVGWVPVEYVVIAPTPTPTPVRTSPPTPRATAVPRPPATAVVPSSPPSSPGDSPGYYTNKDGIRVPRPGGDPAGATAQCQDGTYSYSLNRRGTCSGHGGVARWLQ